MCGIAGFWTPAAPAGARPDALEPMVASLHHRGPDGNGHHVDPERGLAMGHARLSIIDLDTGAQPLRDPDGGCVLTVNGEFYDYKRIRARLACAGHRFRTKSDSEIALPLYRRHDLAFVDHLRGEFALALFDARRERLVLVRDRFGIKPLCYRLDARGIHWGSEAKAILAHPDVDAPLCPRAALHQMMQVMVPGTTAFAGVRALLPGHMLVVERDGDRLRARTRRYWDLEFPDADAHDPDPDPAPHVEGVRERLIDAIALRLEADVPVGCYLSGGIDSCTILGLATPMQQSPVKAFTIAFDHADYDESAIARAMAERTGADQELLHLSGTELYGEAFERTLVHAERTFYNTLAVAKWHMSRRVRDCGFKVVITGEGSDELFGGYPFFKRDLLRHAPGDADGAALGRRLDASNGLFRGAILAETDRAHPAWDDLCGFTPSWIQPWMIVLDAVRPLLAEPVRDELRDHDPIAAVAEAIDPAQVRGRHPLDAAQYTWCKTMLEGQILAWGGDRVDMANSMESRPAFLDHRLAEFAVRIPPALRIRDGVEKWVLREALREVLPEVLRRREKFAFMAPPSHVDAEKRAAMDALVARWLAPEMLAEVGLFDPDRVARRLDEARAERDPVAARRHDIVLNHLVQLHMLHAAFAPCPA